MKRYLYKQIEDDVLKKMIFLAGPRQVGKTTLAKSINSKKQQYLNWDISEDRQVILTKSFATSSELLILDEIHKYRSWRNYIKGLYDSRDRHGKRIIVTGSAKLDYYRFGGDSLQGRYFFFRLHPLSVAEVGAKSKSDLEALFKFGGFPEPFLSQSLSYSKRWSIQYRDRLVREDIVAIENISDVGNLELLALRLPDLVSSPLSINSLSEDIQVSHRVMSKWLEVLERSYCIFRLPPFGAPRIRAVKKEQKHYQWDWSLINEPGKRFENFIASHLLKWVNFQKDVNGEEFELRYFRDRDGREVDFIVTDKQIPVLCVEAKYSKSELSRSLIYFKNKFPKARCVQVHFGIDEGTVTDAGIEQTGALNFLSELV